MGYCNHCEKEVARGKFCKTCGRQLVQSTDAEVSKKSKSEPAIKMSIKSLLAHMLPLLMLLIGFYVGAFFFLLWIPGYVLRFMSANNPVDKTQATESLNFAVLFSIVYLLTGILFATRIAIMQNTALVIFLLLAVLTIVSFVWGIVKVSMGKQYKYPVSLRLVK